MLLWGDALKVCSFDSDILRARRESISPLLHCHLKKLWLPGSFRLGPQLPPRTKDYLLSQLSSYQKASGLKRGAWQVSPNNPTSKSITFLVLFKNQICIWMFFSTSIEWVWKSHLSFSGVSVWVGMIFRKRTMQYLPSPPCTHAWGLHTHAYQILFRLYHHLNSISKPVWFHHQKTQEILPLCSVEDSCKQILCAVTCTCTGLQACIKMHSTESYRGRHLALDPIIPNHLQKHHPEGEPDPGWAKAGQEPHCSLTLEELPQGYFSKLVLLELPDVLPELLVEYPTKKTSKGF